MEATELYGIIKEIIAKLSSRDPSYSALPETLDPETSLDDLGLDITTLPEVVADLESRLGGRDLKLGGILNPSDLNTMSIGDLLKQVGLSLAAGRKNPITVYVDDEEENIFVFKRKYGKRLNLKTFTSPTEALAFIKASDDVALVITDEVMPGMGGNELCDAVHAFKPLMKFVLMTGNPNSDGDLMYRSLSRNRFYDFINKPVDFEKKGEEYFAMFQRLLASDI
jgi:CheY-like chemotaxis protein